MTIYSNDRTEARGPFGLDAKMFVGDGASFLYDTKEAIPLNYRYDGMIVYEIPGNSTVDAIYPIWQLKGGTSNNYWVQINTASGGGTQGLIQTDIHRETASGYIAFFSLPGGYKLSNTQVYQNGILVTNETGIKPETFYTLTDYVNYSALEFVDAPEGGTSIVVVKSSLYLT